MQTALRIKLLAVALVFISFLTSISTAFAAAPDGNGPWADTVLSSHQGMMKNGSPVVGARSNPSSALGVAENNTVDGNFFSLGFGGSIALGFDNGISTGVIVVEATNIGYPSESAKVEVSENGTTWVNAGTVTQDGTVNKPAGIACAKYVRLTDVSNPNDFYDGTADGYDVDGVKASGDACKPPHNGGGTCTGDIVQVNNAKIVNKVDVTSNTGKNKSNSNTGGNTAVTSGDVTSIVSIATNTNTNTVSGNDCCCGTGKTDVTIKGNGAGSKNTVIIDNKADKKAKKVAKR